MSRQAVKKATNFTTLVLIGALIIFSVYGYQKGIFTNREQLELFIRQSSFWGPLLFIVIQIAQVVIALCFLGHGMVSGTVPSGSSSVPVSIFISQGNMEKSLSGCLSIMTHMKKQRRSF